MLFIATLFICALEMILLTYLFKFLLIVVVVLNHFVT